MIAVSLWKHQTCLSSLRLLLKWNNYLNSNSTIKNCTGLVNAGNPAYVYTEASSLWASEEPASGIPGTDPWALGFISVLSPSSHCPAWLPTAPGQGPSFVYKWQSGPDCPRGARYSRRVSPSPPGETFPSDLSQVASPSQLGFLRDFEGPMPPKGPVD